MNQFALNNEIVDLIVFAMEDQDHQFAFDTRTLTVCSVNEIDRSERFIDIPEWNSAHGYHLMEQFVGSLRNPVYRERLKGILSSGRRVFRQFKDTIKERNDIERLWFRFKEQYMRRTVYDWYNRLREMWGLDAITLTEEGTEDLILSDFTLRTEYEEAGNILEKWDRQAFFESLEHVSEEFRSFFYHKKRDGITFDSGTVLTLRTDEDSLAGFLWFHIDELSPGMNGVTKSICSVRQLFVLPEYRGLGIARMLLECFTAEMSVREISSILVELPGEHHILNNELVNMGFSRFSQIYELKPEPPAEEYL